MISPLDSAVFGELFRGPADITAVFSDQQRIADLVAVEVALARAESAAGVIPAAAAAAIEAAARDLQIDVDAVARGVTAAGVPVIEIVKQLRRAVGPGHASFVHYGATSQDIVDTAMILALRRATALLGGRLTDAIGAFADLSNRHRATVMAGRTHGQHATPTTVGLKAAGWLAPLVRHSARLRELSPRVFVVQFGGAAGTLASLGDRGLAVGEALARELDLGEALPWHTQRDAIVEYGNWLSLLTGSLAKMAQDVILLAQTDVAEVAESADSGRGGSSAMPHKTNPIASEMIVVAARANAALLSALHASAIQEHERATHGWQLEWFALPQMVALAHGALAHGTFVARHLQVDAGRMRDNMERAGSVVLAEALTRVLTARMPVDEAQALVKDASEKARIERQSLVAVVRRLAADRGVAEGIDWQQADDPSKYLGEALAITDRILAAAKRIDG